jgi:hypothetical protein
MADIENILKEIKVAAIDLAKSMFSDYAKEAEKDVKSFLKKSKEDLKRYSELLLNGQITELEFKSLLEGKKALAEMKLLKQQGILMITIDKFQNKMIDTILGVVKGFIPI